MKSVIKRKHPLWRVLMCPLADGGDGTLQVLERSFKGRRIHARVRGPLGKMTPAMWVMAGKTAIIEMARASGLALVKGKNRILHASTFGTGQLIKAALDKGCHEILLGVGGTATSDGGAGALEALGLRYFDAAGRRLSGRPKELARLKTIDWTHFDKRILKTKIRVICDVKNPLLGPHGSARAFAPQKGATPRQVRLLERVLKKWASFAHPEKRSQPGSGAAGALAFGLSAYAGARLVRGAPFVMKMTGWHRYLKKACLILTGEGRLDRTSFSGKVIGEIERNRGDRKIWVVCGSHLLKGAFLKRHGIDRVETMGNEGLKTPTRALASATERLLKAMPPFPRKSATADSSCGERESSFLKAYVKGWIPDRDVRE